MTGLLARLAARGAGRPLAGAPPRLAAPVRPRFAPPETGVDREIGEAWQEDAAEVPPGPVPRHESEDEPRKEDAAAESLGGNPSEPSPQDEQVRPDALRVQADDRDRAKPSTEPAADRSDPASADQPDATERAMPRLPTAPPQGTSGPPMHRTRDAPDRDPGRAPRQPAEPRTGHMGVPETPARDALPGDEAPRAAGSFVPQHLAMRDLPQDFDPGAAQPASGPPPPRLAIGRVEVIFEAPQPPPAPRRRAAPERTRGFAGFDRARLGLRR